MGNRLTVANTERASATTTLNPSSFPARASAAVKSTAPKTSMIGGGENVVPHAGAACGQFSRGVAAHDPVQLQMAEGAESDAAGLDHQFGAGVATLDDGGQRHRPLIGDGIPKPLVEIGHRYQPRRLREASNHADGRRRKILTNPAAR